jgi:putative transposase
MSEKDLFMYRTDRIYVTENHELYAYLDGFAHKAKCLHNAALFRVRNAFTAYNKTALTANEKEVQGELALLKGQKSYYVLGKGVVEHVFRITNNPDFFSGLPMQTAQHVIRQVCTDFKGWLASLKKYRKDPSGYTGKPKMPGYCRNDTASYLFTNQDAVIYDGKLKLPRTKIRIPVRRRHGRLMEVKVKPVSGGYELLLVYQVKAASVQSGKHAAAVDFGVDNTMAVVSDTGRSILFKGRFIKSVNQYFMKKKAERISLMSKGKETTERVWSKYLDRLSAYRTSYIRDCFHKMSRKLLVWCQRNDIGCLVLGSNAFWKQNSSIGTVNNQNFVSIPFEMLKSMIELKACEYGVTVVRNEESYTSKASFLDLDFIPVYSEEEPNKKYHFSGRRIHRGLYKSADGTLINADINGAANILRKAGYDVSNIKIARLLNPTILHFKDLNCK